MAKVNGTTVLLYYNGQVIACQQGLNLSINDSIIDISSKDSLGWFNGFSGMKDAKITFKALYSTGLMTDNPKVLSAKGLADSLIAKDRILITIQDIGFPIIGELLTESLSFDAPSEKAVGLSGSGRVKGKLYWLRGTSLITNPVSGANTYDTIIASGASITSAINLSGTALVSSNAFTAFNIGDVLEFITFLTKTSGELPSVQLVKASDGSAISNQVGLVEGLNFITLTVTVVASGELSLTNTDAANWNTSQIYLFQI